MVWADDGDINCAFLVFLLDEEAALELADETPDGQTTSTVETKNAYAERGATTQTTSRPGMYKHAECDANTIWLSGRTRYLASAFT
jgi:hypothetical protein